MATQRQIEANRSNSQLSTGPRTPAGKSVSRFNALKSGINAKAQVIPGEDPLELEAMVAGYHQDWVPVTWLERFLVDSLVRADWLLQRLSRLEAELWAHHVEDARTSAFNKLDENAPIGDVYSRNYERFTRLQRRIDSTERSYYRALTQLQRLRSGAQPEPDYSPAELPSDPFLAPPPPEEPAASSPAAPELGSFCQTPPSLSPAVSSIPDLLSSGHEFLGMDRINSIATHRFQYRHLSHDLHPGREVGRRADTGSGRSGSRSGEREGQIRARR